MKHAERLFQCNAGTYSKKLIDKGRFVYTSPGKEVNGRTIHQILGFVNCVISRYPTVKMPIVINLGDIVFADKLTYIFLEIIVYILMKEYKYPVYVYFRCTHNIQIEGISKSPLLLLGADAKKNTTQYMDKFESELRGTHFRKLMRYGQGRVTLSKMMGDVSHFLKNAGIEESSFNELAEVAAELVGNAWEHTASDCLIDLDVTTNYGKADSDANYVGVNLSVVNFSDQILGDLVKEKLSDPDIRLPERYQKVQKAFEIHKKYFGSSYKQDDFYNIVSFQHKISGRAEKMETGGTGLTKLIASLENRSDFHRCYVISGDRALWFHQEFLRHDSDHWIGFNVGNDFFGGPPDASVTEQGLIYMPGTAYNLNFVLERNV
jgi:hypothetical protein